jgi:hypothetical protein
MAQTIKLKRSATQGAIPTTAQLELGEVAINTYDGKMYIKKNDGSESIIEVGSTAAPVPGGSDGQVQFNNNGVLAGTSFIYADDTNSRLGIGTTTPLTDLHVDGTATFESSVDFRSADGLSTISVDMLDTDTLSFSGNSGQLFSITDALTGTIFSVNDISGVPSIEVDDDGTVRFAESTGNVLIGTFNDDSTHKLQVNGTISATGGNSTEWNTAYDNSITSAAVTGTDTKTLTLTQQDGGTVTASWTDDITQSLNVEYIQFDTAQTGATAIGQVAWNTDTETLELGLSADVSLEIGEQNYFSVKAGEALSAGDVVYASGAVGNSGKIEVSKYIANNTIEERFVLGLAAEDIAVGEFGYVISLGTLRGISTDGSALTVPETWISGTVLYASPTVAGELTSTQPVAPNQAIALAFVTSDHASNGALAVRAYDLGLHIDEIHDVYVNGVANNDILAWNSTNSRWENTDIPTIVDDRYVNVTGDTMTGDLTLTTGKITFNNPNATTALDLNNNNIVDVNNITFSDAGVYEGLVWPNISIFESPNDFSNANGNFQVAHGGTRRLTVDSSGLDVNGRAAADIYYDTANTTYYLDLNSTSTSLKIPGNVELNNSKSIYLDDNGTGTPSRLWRAGGNGTRFEYYDNSFIFDSKDNAHFEIRDSLDTTQLRFDPLSANLDIEGSFSAVNTTLTGFLRGPSSFVIDPAAHGDDTGTVVIAGNLQVDGTTTTINSTTVTVDDKNLVLASGSTNAAAADGAGITIDCGTDTNATLLYDGVDDQFELNKTLHVTGDAGNTATFEGDTQSTINLLAGTTSNYIVGTTSGAISLRPNTATAMTLLSNGNVGIGVAAPTNKLDVAGSLSATNIRLGSTASGEGLIRYNPGTGNNGVGITTGSIDSSGIKLFVEHPSDGGGVGIGTTTPATALHVVGSSGEMIRWGLNNTVYGKLSAGTAGARLDVTGANSGYGLAFSLDDSTKMTILPSGNVGINKTDPGVALHVRAIDETTVGLFEASGVANLQVSSEGSRASMVLADSGGVTGAINSVPGNGLKFGIGANFASNIAMTIDASRRVGIGTQTPTKQLVITQSDTNIDVISGKNLGGGGVGNGVLLQNLDTTTVGSYANLDFRAGTADGRIAFVRTSAGNNIGDFVFVTDNTGSPLETLRITNEGKLGLLTDAPTARMDIRAASQGELGLSVGYGSQPNLLVGTSTSFTKLEIANGNYHHTFRTRTSAGVAEERFTIEGGADTAKAYFLNSEVGIGTANPGAMLSVIAPDGSTNSLRLGRADNASYWNFIHAGNDLRIYNGNGINCDILFGIDSGGNSYNNKLGIGVADPESKLHVDGTIAVSNFGTASTTKTFLIPSNNIGNSDLIIKGGNFVHSVRYQTSWNDFEYARLISSYNTAHTILQLNQSASDGSLAAQTIISTGDSSFTGSVGIGISSPVTPLHIHEAGTGSGDHAYIHFTTGDTGNTLSDGMTVGYNAAQVGVINVREASDLNIATNGETRIAVKSGGNVGVGTSSPAALLDVYSTTAPKIRISNGGGTSPNPQLEFFRQAGVSANITYDVANKNFIFENEFAGTIQFKQGGAEQARISAAGNLGLNNTDPQYTIHATRAMASAPSNVIYLELSGTNADGGGGAIRFDTSASNSSTNAFYASVEGVRSNSSDGSNQLRFYTADANINGGIPTQKMVLTQTGNLGVGVSNPSFAVDIITGENSQLRLDGNDTSPTTIVMDYNSTGATNRVRIQNDTGDMRFTTNNGEVRQSITKAGYIGIGTTSPEANLHIKSLANVGDATLILEADADNNNEADNPRLELRQDGNLIAGYLYLEGNPSQTVSGSTGNSLVLESKGNSDTPLHFATGGLAPVQGGGPTDGTVRMTILGDGNVGIGSTTPDKLLVVSGAGAEIVINDTDTTDTPRLRFRESGTTSGTISTDGSHMIFTYGSDEGMRITSDGKVGIGETAPDTKLEVAGQIKASVPEDNFAFQVENATETGFKYRIYNDGSNQLYSNSFTTGLFHNTTENAAVHFYRGSGITGGFLTFTTNDGTERMRIAGTGDIGINTNTFVAGAAKVQICGDDTSPTLSTTGITDCSLILSNSDDDYGMVFATNGDGRGYIQQRRVALATYYDLNLQPYGGGLNVGMTSSFTTGGTAKLSIKGLVSFGESNSDMSYIRRQDVGEFCWQTFNGGNAGEIQLQPYGGAVVVGTATGSAGRFHVVGGSGDQTVSIDSPTLPNTSLFATMVLDGTYTDGKYRTRFSKIDRGGNLPLYVQESLATANSFVNIARFGSHSNSVHKFEVFGSFKGTYFETANNAIIRKNVDGWGYTPHDILHSAWSQSTGDYVYLKAAGNSDGAHGIIVAADNGFYIGSDNLETGVIADSATAPITNTWAYVNPTGLTVNGSVDVNSTFTLKGEEATLATTTQTQIATFSATAYGGGKFVITAKDGVNRHICELLVTHDGTTAVATQYGSVTTNGDLATYQVDISGGNVRILATSASTNSTVYKVVETLMEA